MVKECKKTDLPVIIAIPRKDEPIFRMFGCNELFLGSENDVISRYYHCAKKHKFDPIIRVCADSKEIKPELILQQLENYKKYGFAYGNWCEVFSFKELEHYYKHDRRPEVREHVVYGMIHDRAVNWEIDL